MAASSARQRVVIALAGTLLPLGFGCNRKADGPADAPTAPSLAAAETTTLRLVAETPPDTPPAEAAARARAVLGASARVEPLFPGESGDADPDGLRRFLLVEVSQPQGEGPWDVAYRLREAARLLRVEPDVPQPIYEPESMAARGACFLPDDPAVRDRGWSGRLVRVREAWALPPQPGGARFGEGILVAHPDTGWTVHDDLDRLELTLQRNVMRNTADARDPLDYGGNPGHGTATGSVIASGGELAEPPAQGEGGTVAPGKVTGIAPRAKLIPIRAVRSVVQVFDSDVARAVRHATRSGAHVISMSLGGKALFGLEAAINDAVRHDLIVLAAAGNCVGFVVSPAAFENTIAVAAVGPQRKPWRGSSRGRAVRISAPGEQVWGARAGGDGKGVGRGQGTSYAVATTAGAAALWLAHHGRAGLLAHYRGGAHLQDVFARLLRDSAQPGVDLAPGKFGAGILDAARLLSLPLPADLRAANARRAPLRRSSQLEVMERVLDVDREVLRQRLGALLRAAPGQEEAAIERFGPELLEIFLARPETFAPLTVPEAAGPAARSATDRLARTTVSVNASRALRAALAGNS